MGRSISLLERCARIAMLSGALVGLAPIGSATRRMRRAEESRAFRLLDAARADAAADRARALGIREPRRAVGA